MIIVGAGAAARPDGVGVLAAAAQCRLACQRRQGARLERLQRAAWRGLARGGPGSRLRAGRRRPGRCRHAGGGRRRCARHALSAGRRRDRDGRHRATPSSSIRAATAMPAPIAPTSCCRARPTRKRAATYVNLEGRAQMTNRAAFAPGEAKEDWAIIRALSAHAGHTLPYDQPQALRAAMYKAAPQLMRLDASQPARLAGVAALAARERRARSGTVRRAVARLLFDEPDRARLSRSWPSSAP